MYIISVASRHSISTVQCFPQFGQHLVARMRTVPTNQITEGFEFCSLIGSHDWNCCNVNWKLQEFGKALYRLAQTWVLWWNTTSAHLLNIIKLHTCTWWHHMHIPFSHWNLPTSSLVPRLLGETAWKLPTSLNRCNVTVIAISHSTSQWISASDTYNFSTLVVEPTVSCFHK